MLSNEKYKGDALLQKTYTVDFLLRKRAENTGEVPQYYVENSNPAIVDEEIWEAAQLEMERRRVFSEEHDIKQIDFVKVDDNPFASRVICGECGSSFGRKTWNSTNKSLKRKVWQCNRKYEVKGEVRCKNKHIDDEVLYKALISTFNALVNNKEHFMDKWKRELESEDLLKRYRVREFIKLLEDAVAIEEFDIDLYFKMIEKMTVFEGKRILVSLLDETEIECRI